MAAAIAFVNRLNARRLELRLSPISWHERCARVLPSPARVRWLWKDAPSDMTDDDVRHLLAIDAVFMLCFFQSLGCKFPQIQALDPDEAVIWRLEGIMHDFLLMENQIPLVLIQNALALALEGEHRKHAKLDRVVVINPSPDDDSSSVDSDVDERVDLVCAEAFHPEVDELLSSVLGTVLVDAGLQGFSDNVVPRSQTVSSDHLLDLVYRVVAFKFITPDVDGDDNPRPGRNSTRLVGALIKQDRREKSLYFFLNLMIYLGHLQSIFPRRFVAAFHSRLQNFREDRWRNSHFIPTASKLRKAGIAVKGLKDAKIWDYKMEQGLFTDTLCIPKLDLWFQTANSLRNLLLIEMRHQSLMNREWQPLMEYLILLDQLVDTREDAVILCDNTDDYVIFNTLGDAGVAATKINDPCQGCLITGNSPRFVKFCRDVQQWYKRRRKRILREFVETHLNKPWKIASLLAAILLLVLTALQTLYSILSFYGI
ncbi:hypothetical protein MPTK1_2g07840 [Marchantia polymorpha subsp. ruderalis]|uniref:Uncharacterized protein n=1 Tax=Marchantia polymorpha TaxID=3197 RepID=A0A2R6XGN6_MARPO|nr:hypothetical protein MARPO_0015s0070 [Marchantia polymorpha]BBN01494.1 hypothetical protein Mp_2g07840 [Marchantia polymorpha subsp. ruderalis]|eukprot:PTQ45262.1 hypothetical protein MARPO_0015s0070 [Marchantia polymorpha]